MPHDGVIFSIFIIFTGAAVLATLALLTRQSLIVAYILLGALLGPYGVGFISNPEIVTQIGDVGILFLLFLLGLNLHPQNLLNLLKTTTVVTLVSSFIFAMVGLFIAYLFGFGGVDLIIIAVAMIFSSTIIGLKLLPTTVLHHQRMGEIIISVLLLQDLIAILVLLLINESAHGFSAITVITSVVGLPILVIGCFLFEKWVLMRLFSMFDRIQEYIFLVALGWCLGVAQLAHMLGLSYEIGAFIAGVALAQNSIALFISESLKPLRDFFLILFFFALGATFNLHMLAMIIWPALILALAMLLIKPFVFKWLLGMRGEKPTKALEMGVRLGQVSEFSLLVAFVAFEQNVISEMAYQLIQTTTMLTFIVSSYWIVLKYPTPIAISDRLRRD